MAQFESEESPSISGVIFMLLVTLFLATVPMLGEYKQYEKNRTWIKTSVEVTNVSKRTDASPDVEITGSAIPEKFKKYSDKNFRSPYKKNISRAAIPFIESLKLGFPKPQFVFINFSYKAKNGKLISRGRKITIADDAQKDAYDFYSKLSAGQKFTAYYNPQNPSEFQTSQTISTYTITLSIFFALGAYFSFRIALIHIFKSAKFYWHLGDVLAIIACVCLLGWIEIYKDKISSPIMLFEQIIFYYYCCAALFVGCLIYQTVYARVKTAEAKADKKFNALFQSNEDKQDLDYDFETESSEAPDNEKVPEIKPGKLTREKKSESKWDEVLDDPTQDDEELGESYQTQHANDRLELERSVRDYYSKPTPGKLIKIYKLLNKKNCDHQIHKPAPMTRKSWIVIYIIFIATSLVLSGLFGYFLIRELGEEKFIQTQGKIIESKLPPEISLPKNPKRTKQIFLITYKYKVGGENFKASNLLSIISPATDKSSSQKKSVFPPGKSLTVFYNEKHPAESYLMESYIVKADNSRIHDFELLILFLFAGVFCAAGYYFLFTILVRYYFSRRYQNFQPEIEDLRSGFSIPCWGKISSSSAGFNLKSGFAPTETAGMFLGIIFSSNFIGIVLCLMTGWYVSEYTSGMPIEYILYYYSIAIGLAIISVKYSASKGTVKLDNEKNLLLVIDYKNEMHYIPPDNFKRWGFEYFSTSGTGNQNLWSGMISLYLKDGQKILVRAIDPPGNYDYNQLEAYLEKVASLMNKTTTHFIKTSSKKFHKSI